MTARTRWILILLLLVGLALRLGWALSRHIDYTSLKALPDQLEYLAAGRHLLHGEGLWFTDTRFGQRIYAGRTVGYPLLVAACDGQIRAIQAAQCILDVSTALAAFLIARRWLGDLRGLLACALVIVNPVLIHFCALVLTETLYVCMLCWSLLLLLQRRTVVWGILLCALSVHVRPSGLPMPAVLAALGAWVWSPRPAWPRVLSMGVAAVLATFLVLLPWALRNEKVLGRFVLLASNSGITFFDGVHAGATGASDQSFVDAMPQLSGMGEMDRDDYLNAQAWRCVREEPGRMLSLAVRKAMRTWSPMPLSEQFGNRLYVAVGLLYSLPLFVLAAVGLMSGALPMRVRLALLAPALLITLMQMVTVGSLRYRLPAEPMLCVLAASAGAGARRISDTSRTPPCAQ